jgi:transposase-like protein
LELRATLEQSEKFGENLLAMTIYLNIALQYPNRELPHFQRNTGLSFSAVLNRFKSIVALYYKPATETYERSLRRLIHADETEVNVKGQIGYVWAFTNLREVVMIYPLVKELGS